MTEFQYLDRSRLASTLGVDSREKLVRFYELYVEQLDTFLVLLRNLELPQQSVKLAECAHKYKSSSHVMGADLLAMKLEALENRLAEGGGADRKNVSEVLDITEKTRELVLREISADGH